MHPEVLKALSPSYAFDFLFHSGSTGFFPRLRGPRDHRGARRSTPTWATSGGLRSLAPGCSGLPACILSYLGQGALIIDDPNAIGAPLLRLMPDGGLVPLVVLATAATAIASQAVISGTFSIAHQASQLGYLPRSRVIHTSERAYGQVYVPTINWSSCSPCSRWCSPSAARRSSPSLTAWR